MTRGDTKFQHRVNGIAISAGFLYAAFRYFIKGSDPYAAVSTHALEPWARDIHLLTAQFLVLAIGMVWYSHAAKKLRKREKKHKKSGYALVLTALPMILSAVLIQISVNETSRRYWVVIHLISSSAWALGYVIHYFKSKKKK